MITFLRSLFRSRVPLFIVIFLVYLYVSYSTLDPDFGWHLVAGQYFLSHGIPKTDIFTFTAPHFPWIDHEWLSDILTYRLYNLVGYLGVSVFFALLWTCGLYLAGRKTHGVLIVLALLATIPFAGIRTITWSFVFVALIYFLFSLKQRYIRLLFIPLFFLWANLHGSFFIGLLLLAYEAIRTKSWKVGILAVVSTLVTFINPYGARVYVEIARTLFDTQLHTQVQEWASFNLPLIALPYIVAVFSLFVLTEGKKIRAYAGRDMISFLASLFTLRNTPLFVVLALPLSGERFKKVLALIPKNLRRSQKNVLYGLYGLLIFVTALCVFVSYLPAKDANTERFPINAVAALREQPCTTNTFNLYEWGGYLIWKDPGVKVFIDGRMPSWQDGSIKYMTEYYKILSSPSFRRVEFQKYNVSCVLIPKNYTLFINALKQDGWSSTTYPDGAVILRSK